MSICSLRRTMSQLSARNNSCVLFCSGAMKHFVPRKFRPTPYHYHAEVNVEVISISSEGHGVAVDPYHPERTVLVPKVWPGECVTVRIHRNHMKHSEADLVRVVVPSPERITPKCSYFNSCAGCQFQHIAVSTQHAWKKKHVLSLLEGSGCELNSAVIDDIVATSNAYEYHYRSKITPQLSYEHLEETRLFTRDKNLPEKYSDRALKIGFSRVGSRRVVDIPECILATHAVNKQYKTFRADQLAKHEERCRSGEEIARKGRRMKLKSSALFRDDMSNISGSSSESGGSCVHTDSNAFMTQDVSGLQFTFKAGEFFQVNPIILPSLVAHVVGEAKGSVSSRHAGGSGDGSDSDSGELKYLIDAYCGSGLFSLSAADHFSSVVGIEVSTRAVTAAKQNAAANGIDNVSFICGKVESLFEEVYNIQAKNAAGATTVIIDPSRKGCDHSFLNQLIIFGPERVVYVSCNPATQARDARVLLDNGYIISRVTPFDMFPHTKHIENVLTFERVCL